MNLEKTWKLVESINNKANQESQAYWLSNNIDNAVCYQTECFRNNFLKIEISQQQAIIYWFKNDDEFQDYVKCLAGNDFIINFF